MKLITLTIKQCMYLCELTLSGGLFNKVISHIF